MEDWETSDGSDDFLDHLTFPYAGVPSDIGDPTLMCVHTISLDARIHTAAAELWAGDADMAHVVVGSEVYDRLRELFFSLRRKLCPNCRREQFTKDECSKLFELLSGRKVPGKDRRCSIKDMTNRLIEGLNSRPMELPVLMNAVKQCTMALYHETCPRHRRGCRISILGKYRW
jgi:hypothetical protein